jgi:ribonuclease HI
MIQLYTDGGSRGNPGPAAFAYLIYDEDKELTTYKKKLGTTTNNVAEYTAVLEGLKRAATLDKEVQVFSDSELVVKQLNSEYKIKKPHLKELYIRIKQVESKLEKVSYTHRSRSHKMQKLADKLVNEALDS